MRRSIPSLRPKPPGDGPRFTPAEVSLYLVHNWIWIITQQVTWPSVTTGCVGATCQWSSSTLLRHTWHVECICNLAISSNRILLLSFQLAKLSISLWKLHICLLTTSLFVKLQHLLISVIVWHHVGTLRRIGVWPPLSLFSFRKRGSIGIKEMGQHTIKLVYR